MSAATVPARAKRHPMPVIVEARRLAEGGWSPREIVRLLEQRGIIVSERSVARWADETIAERDRRECLARSRRKAATRDGRLAGFLSGRATPEFKLARMRALRSRSVSFRAIAVVMEFDFGDALSDDQVRHALMLDRYPKRVSA